MTGAHLLFSLCFFGLCGGETRAANQSPVRQVRRPPQQLTLISDVDDTIKNTGVTVGRTHLKNLPWLLLDPVRPWRPVPGMPELYQKIQKKRHAQFLYLSKGPSFSRRRLELNLVRFQFPAGKIQLNGGFPFAPANYKFTAITPIILQNAASHYILFGDSGETDPENYGMLARKFPRQVDRIYIRSITSDRAERYQNAFRQVPRSKWRIFASPQELKF